MFGKMIFILLWFTVVRSSCAAGSVLLSCPVVGETFEASCAAIKQVAQTEGVDLYFTGYAWHIDGYDGRRNQKNDYSWGGGTGKHWIDASGNEDAVWSFIFMDSHHDPEPAIGYSHQWLTHSTFGLSVGAGYYVGISARNDVLHYIPFPIALPIASIRFRDVSLIGSYLPRLGTLNNGNLAFFFSRISF